MTNKQQIEDLVPREFWSIEDIIHKINEVIKVVNQLAPALPEEEECEVVDATKVVFEGYERYTGDYTFTKPDGKKLKIKVVEKQ